MLVIMTPWRALCVNLRKLCILKGKGNTSIELMCLTMIDSATSWFKIVEPPTITKLTVPNMGKGKKVTRNDYTKEVDMASYKPSAQISNLVYNTWFSKYPCCWYLIYNNRCKFKLHFHALWDTYGIKHKLTSVKNPQANAILERIHAVVMNTLCTAEIDMANLVKLSDIDIFLADAAWVICSTNHTVLEASPGAAITCSLTFCS